MTTVYLVRHAHAEFSPDDHRPLSIAGRDASVALASLLAAEPVTAIYSSPLRRSVETVTPLADAFGIALEHVPDFREREIPPLPVDEFLPFMERTWRSPGLSVNGAETSTAAQARGLTALRRIVHAHPDAHVVVATHGNLLTLMLNGLDATFGYEFWRRLSLPDVYRLKLEGMTLVSIDRIWSPGSIVFP